MKRAAAAAKLLYPHDLRTAQKSVTVATRRHLGGQRGLTHTAKPREHGDLLTAAEGLQHGIDLALSAYEAVTAGDALGGDLDLRCLRDHGRALCALFDKGGNARGDIVKGAVGKQGGLVKIAVHHGKSARVGIVEPADRVVIVVEAVGKAEELRHTEDHDIQLILGLQLTGHRKLLTHLGERSLPADGGIVAQVIGQEQKVHAALVEGLHIVLAELSHAVAVAVVWLVAKPTKARENIVFEIAVRPRKGEVDVILILVSAHIFLRVSCISRL